MNSNLVEDQKALYKAFLKIKVIRELLESFKVKRTPFWNSLNKIESKRLSKNNTQDFLKKLSYQSTNLFIKAVADASLYFKINSTCLH